jgi:hypothetical protein
MTNSTRERVVSLFESKGWTRHQALGLAANFQSESAFNPDARGDGGKAYGLAQWHPDRQAEFQKQFGKSIVGSSIEEQVAFADHELRQGNERAAGQRLASTKTAAEAASAVSLHYERPADRAGEAAKRARLAAQLAGEPVSVLAAEAPARAAGAPARGEDWPALPTRAPKAQAASTDADKDAAKMAGVTTMMGQAAALDTPDASRATFEAGVATAATAQARKDATGVGAVASEALRDPRVMPTWTLFQRLENGAKVVDPSWDYMANREKIEAGLSDDEREYMRENGVYNQDEATRARAEIETRRGSDEVYGNAGGFAAFAGQMAAGITDPASLVLGLGTMKAFQLAKIGSAAMVAQGRGGAAVGSMMAENALGNVAVEGLADYLGDVKTTADYAMAGAAGAVLTTPFARGVFRQANEAHITDMVRDLQERGVNEQVAAAAAVRERDPSATPEQVARRVEEAEAENIRTAVDAAVGPQRIDSVVPEDIARQMRDEFEGVEPAGVAPAKAAPEPTGPVVRKEPPGVIEQIREGTLTREIADPESGETVRLSWSGGKAASKNHGSVAETLTMLADPRSVHVNPVQRRLATYLTKVMSQDQLDIGIRFSGRADAASLMDPNTSQIRINDGGTGIKSSEGDLFKHVARLTKYGVDTVLHEVMHVATYHRLNAWETNAGKLRPSQQKVLRDFEDLFERFKAMVEEHANQGSRNTGARYAAKNLHEFAAQFYTDGETRNILSVMPGKAVAGRTSNALAEFIGLIRRVLGLTASGGKSAFEEGSKLLDRMISMPVDNITYRNNQPVFGPDAPDAAPANPLDSRNARERWGEQMVQHARDYMARFPIDMAKLKTATMKIGGASDGLILAASKNPIMQLVASLVTETTTGAAGRKANVAIRSEMLGRKFVGNTMIDYDHAYVAYRGRNGGGVLEDAYKGDVRRGFDNKVYEEVLRRRNADYAPNRDQTIVEAADALEALFERARLGQIDGGVLGFANLPATSRGYVPQALDGIKLQAMSLEDMGLLHAELSRNFQERLGWDKKFADSFAPFYTDRARLRAMGDKNVEGLGAGGEGLQLIRDSLEKMDYDPAILDRVRAGLSQQGMGQTKKRLDIDLLKELRPGLRVMDFYNTNPLLMARSYAKRTAGTVALTEAGIHGLRGMRELRKATMLKGVDQPTQAELDSFDRVMAEILGTPIAGAVVSAGATNMRLIVSLQRLGGLVFTQAAETFNMLHHLGLRSTLSGIKDLPKMLGEVGRLKTGAPSGNHILTSIEQYGGEFGMETYKMVAPLDAPDGRLGEYIDQPGVVSRLLRSGGQLQAKISFFRGLMASQHRMVAEQIVMRAARMIRDGGNDVALADMGFTPDVVNAMKGDLATVARWDGNDKLLAFDLTQVSDPRTAEAFVQAVHRGTGQIIQGTFVGERNAWMHNDYLKLLLQLRTFGLTATEKQFARTRMIHGGGAAGYAYAGGMMLGQMALALPIYAARVQLMAAGREDREDYIKKSMNPAAMVRATMNYSSLSGLTGDVLEIISGVAGGFGSKRAQEIVGARQEAASVGRVLPFAGTIDTGMRVVSGKADLHTAIKQLPFGNLWYIVPAINLTKDD